MTGPGTDSKPAVPRRHQYRVEIEWTGDRGTGSSSYEGYGREYTVRVGSKPDLLGSADASFRGDPTRHNPEELLVAALSACHMLSYLHLCAVHGIQVVGYEDHAEGIMEARSDGVVAFSRVSLTPRVTIAKGDLARALDLHEAAHRACFIANSVNFPVGHLAEVVRAGGPAGGSVPPVA